MNASPIRVGVLDGRGLHVQGSPMAPLSLPIAHVGELYERARRRGLSQLWITAEGARALGLPEILTGATGSPKSAAHPFMSDAPGELRRYPNGLAPWIMLGHDRSALALSFPDYDPHYTWGTAAEADAASLLAAVNLYTAALGRPYAWSAGKTGRDLIADEATAGARRGWTRDPVTAWPEPALRADTVPTSSWIRSLSPAEQALRHLHGYDKNAAWLGACSSLELGLGDLTELQGADVAFSAKLPGYWRRPIQGQPGEWHCTPAIARAIERGDVAPITHAYVWQRHTRALGHWYERLRDARAILQAEATPAGALARQAFKRTYAQTISSFSGTWHKLDSPLYRPDWDHAIRAQAAANLSRAVQRLDAAGAVPVAIFKDAVYIVSDDPDPEAAVCGALRLGADLGCFKVEAVAIPLEHVRPAFEPSGQARGIRGLRDAIAAVQAERGQHVVAGK